MFSFRVIPHCRALSEAHEKAEFVKASICRFVQQKLSQDVEV